MGTPFFHGARGYDGILCHGARDCGGMLVLERGLKRENQKTETGLFCESAGNPSESNLYGAGVVSKSFEVDVNTLEVYVTVTASRKGIGVCVEAAYGSETEMRHRAAVNPPIYTRACVKDFFAFAEENEKVAVAAIKERNNCL